MKEEIRRMIPFKKDKKGILVPANQYWKDLNRKLSSYNYSPKELEILKITAIDMLKPVPKKQKYKGDEPWKTI